MHKGEIKRNRIVAKGFVALLVLTIVSSVTVFALSAVGETDTPAEIEIEDLELVPEVWNASLNFADEVTREINISKKGFGGEREIDNLITLMRITLAFMSEIIDMVRVKDTDAGREMRSALNETDLMSDERVEDGFQYLRLLQSENPCEEAINRMERNSNSNSTRDFE